MDTTYKVGIYLRLSREDEKLGESGSISTQRDLLLNYIKDNNLKFVREYVDDGISGTTFNRAGFNQMIKDCEEKKINMIITKDTSRLGRDHIEFGYYVERYFPEHNIRYVALNDGIDTFNCNNSANDMLVFKSAFNDMYVKDISNKLRSSLYTKKRNGLFVGCYAPFGYEKCATDKHKLEIEKSSALIVKQIFDMFINGDSITKIAETLTKNHIPTPSMLKNMNLGGKNIHYGIWSPRTITSILKNPTYMGNLTQCRQRKVNYKSKKVIHTKEDDWLIAKGAIEPIIDKETFLLAQKMFPSNKNRSTKGNGITEHLLLRGLIYCKECQHTIGFRDLSQQTKKYGLVHRIYGNCNYWSKRKKQNVCTPHSIKYEIVEDLVMSNLKDIIKNYLDIKSILNILTSQKLENKKAKLKKDILNIENEILSLNRKIDVCYNDKLEENITLEMYKRTYATLSKEINEKINQKQRYENILVNLENNLNSNYYQEKIHELLKMNNPSRDFICSVIEKIEIDEHKNIYIYYKFKCR